MAVTLNVHGKKVKVCTLYKNKNELIDLIKIGLEVKYGYKNLQATGIEYNRIGFVLGVKYEEDI